MSIGKAPVVCNLNELAYANKLRACIAIDAETVMNLSSGAPLTRVSCFLTAIETLLVQDSWYINQVQWQFFVTGRIVSLAAGRRMVGY